MNIQGILNMVISNGPQILLALLIFSVLIFVHEFGHFSAAKWSKIKVNEFAIGMGPTLWKRQKGETAYTLRLFPMGGFCALEGDDEESEDDRAFGRAPLHKRMVTMLAGSFMNLILGLLLLGILSASLQSLGTTTIYGFYEGAVTDQWLKPGDKIIRMNNHRVRTDNDVSYELMRDRDGIMDVAVERPTADGGTETVLLTSVGFSMTSLEGTSFIIQDFRLQRVEPTFWGIVRNSFNWTASTIKEVWGGFADLITGRYGFNQISGPVGVTSAIGQVAKFGWKNLLWMVAFITVNLGVFNLLPLPALDGGRLVFLILEAVRRKPVNPRYEGLVHGIGFLLLVGLMIVVTINDVAKII